MKLELHFDGPVAPGSIDNVLAALADALAGRLTGLAEVGSTPLVDHQGGRTSSWERRLAGDGARAQERVVLSDVGDPREGYGFDMEWWVDVGPRRAGFLDAAWSPQPKLLHIYLEGVDAVTWRRARAALRGVLGANADGSDRPSVAAALEAGDLEAGRAWLEAAVARPGACDDPGWPRLLSLWPRLHDEGTAEIEGRVLAEPGQLDAWSILVVAESTRRPPAIAAEVLARLQPWRPAHFARLAELDAGAWLRDQAGVWLRDPDWVEVAGPALAARPVQVAWRRHWDEQGWSAVALPAMASRLFRRLDPCDLVRSPWVGLHTESGPRWHATWGARWGCVPPRDTPLVLASLRVDRSKDAVEWRWMFAADAKILAVGKAIVPRPDGTDLETEAPRFAVLGEGAEDVISAARGLFPYLLPEGGQTPVAVDDVFAALLAPGHDALLDLRETLIAHREAVRARLPEMTSELSGEDPARRARAARVLAAAARVGIEVEADVGVLASMLEPLETRFSTRDLLMALARRSAKDASAIEAAVRGLRREASYEVLEVCRSRHVTPRAWTWGDGDSVRVGPGFIDWDVGRHTTRQACSAYAQEGVPGILVLHLGRTPIPDAIRREIYAHLGAEAPDLPTREALCESVKQFLLDHGAAPGAPCARCHAEATDSERLEATEPFALAAESCPDLARARPVEVDHVRRCVACGALYQYTYEYTSLVATDLDTAVARLVKRMWHNARMPCWHPPSGDSVA